MAAPTTVPTEPEPTKLRPGLRALLGCAIGCGALILLAVLAIGVGSWWLIAPGEQVATRGIAGGESTGVIHFDLHDDTGVRELLSHAILEIQRVEDQARAAEMSESMRWLQEMGRRQRGGAAGLGMWIPREMTIAFERAGDGDGLVVAVNLASFPRLIREVVRRTAGAGDVTAKQRPYRGYELEVFPDGRSLAFAGSTILFATEPEVMERALDRLGDGPEAGPLASRLGSEVDDRWDVLSEHVDQVGDLGAALARALDGIASTDPPSYELEAPEVPIADPGSDDEDRARMGAVESTGTAGEAPPAIERVTVGLDVLGADRIDAEIHLDCASAADAREWLGRLEAAMHRFEIERGRGAIEAAIDGVTEDDRVRATIELTGVSTWMDREIAETFGRPDDR